MNVERYVGLSDEALLAGLAVGDTGAAAAFVRRFQPRVFGLAQSVLGDQLCREPLDLNQRLQIHFRFRRDRPAEPGLHRTQLLRVFAQPLFDFAEPAGDHAVFARGRV